MYSADENDAPDALAGIAASAALAVSDIPFNGPISEVRVARVDGEWVINPTFDQMERADIELMVGATYDNIMMVEGEMNEVSETELLEALKVAHEEIKKHCTAQIELMKEAGKETKREYCHEINDDELRADVREKCYDKAYAIAKTGSADKHWRNDAFKAIRDEYLEALPEMTEEQLEKYSEDQRTAMVKRYYHDVEKDAMRRCVLDEESASTAARPQKSDRYGVKWTIFRGLTEPPSSPWRDAGSVCLFCLLAPPLDLWQACLSSSLLTPSGEADGFLIPLQLAQNLLVLLSL